jgi:tetratricopeptide (TPR) repeat protein
VGLVTPVNRMKKNSFLLIICVLLFYSCSVSNRTSRQESQVQKKESNLEFYYAFTEATKQALFNNFNDAINLYKQCLKVNPESGATYFQLSNIYMRTGKLEIAKEYAKKAIEIDKNNKWYYYHLASLHQMKNELDSTVIVYKKIVKIDYRNIDSKFNLILLLAEIEKYKDALKLVYSLKKEIGLNEKLILIEYDLYKRKGDVKKASSSLLKGIEHYPESLELKGLLAEYYAENNEIAKAQEYFDKIYRMEPDNQRVQLSYAEFLLQNNKAYEALEILKNVMENESLSLDIKTDIVIALYSDKNVFEKFGNETKNLVDILKYKYPDDIKIRYLSADINSKTGNFSDVAEDLKAAWILDKSNLKVIEQIIYVENYLNNYDSVIAYADIAFNAFNDPLFRILKGNALMQMNEYQSAIETLEQLRLNNKEQQVQVLNLIAECYRNMLNNKESDKYFEEALKIDETNLIIRNNYGYYLALRSEKLEMAEALSRLTIEKEPKNPTYLDTYAWILFKMGQTEKAKKYILEAIKYGGETNDEILDHYGSILFQEKKYRQAIEIWEKALKLNSENTEVSSKIVKAKGMLKKK